MKYAIIAAGEGSRLASEGIKQPKPLVKINGEALINRLIRIFGNNGATDIHIICNSEMKDVSNHLQQLKQRLMEELHVPIHYIIKSTPSSMHSFHELSKFLNNDPFILTTVDTIFDENEFASYVSTFKQACNEGVDALMGVTTFIDDEKPLYVEVEEDNKIKGFFDTQANNCEYVSAGVYGLTPQTIETLIRCIESGNSRMRNFQRALLQDGWNVRAYPFSKVLDIDHANDIIKAEKFLKK